MKKILLVVLLFLCTGCWDYNELNNLAIVSGIAIDYKGNQFTITYEILNDKKSDNGNSGGGISKVHLVEGSGETIYEAFQNASLSVSKNAYFAHLKAIILSESVAKDKIDDIVDYLLRNPYMDTSTYIVVARDKDASEILDSATEADPVTSEMIYTMLKNDVHNKNIQANQSFETNFALMSGDGKDAVLSSISKKEDTLFLDTLALFHRFDFVDYLSEQDSMTYQLFLGKAQNATYQKSCGENKKTILGIHDAKPKIELDGKHAKIVLQLQGTILENACEDDLNQPDTYLEMQDEFADIIQSKADAFLKTIQEKNSDILGLSGMYYRKYREKKEDIWLDFTIDTEVHLEINKKGLIFEVKEND